MGRLELVGEEALELLGGLQVNMPWNLLPGYLEEILSLGLNPEIGFSGADLDGASEPECREIAERLHGRGRRLTLHGPFWDLCPGSVDPLIRRASRLRLERFFDFAAIFRPVQVVCHTGFDPRHHGFDRTPWLDRGVELWEPLVERAEAMRMPLLLENVWEEGPELHLEIFERLPSEYLGFCLDVGHQNCFSRAGLAVWVEALAGRMKEMHLHDNDGTRDAHLPIGRGAVDFEFLFRALRSRGATPILTLEPHRDEDVGETLAGLARVLAGAPRDDARDSDGGAV